MRDAFKTFGVKDTSKDILILFPVVAPKNKIIDDKEEEERIRKQVLEAISEFVDVKEGIIDSEQLGNQAIIQNIYGSLISLDDAIVCDLASMEAPILSLLAIKEL